MTRQGPVYDDAMKILADDDVGALLSLVTDAVAVERLNVELPATTMKVDLLTRVAQPDGARHIAHVEFLKDLDSDFVLRMVDYGVRIRRKYPGEDVDQRVLVMRDIAVPTGYTHGGLRCAWTVIHLADLDPEPLLEQPVTAAVAALARGDHDERTAALVRALRRLDELGDRDRRNRLLAAATTLASITLSDPRIDAALKEATMPVLMKDTPYGRRLIAEGVKEGRALERDAARPAAHRATALFLRRNLGATDDARIDAVAERLSALPEDERMALLFSVTSLDELDR